MAIAASDHGSDNVKEKKTLVAMTHASITYYNTFFSFSRLGATTYLEAELQYNSDKKGPRQNFACYFEFSCTATSTKNSKM